MPCRVLVADDEELERRALGRILSRDGPSGVEVVEAANGAEAIEAAKGQPFDAAFLDIQMPGIDGIAAARSLREISPNLPIIFLTAHDSFEYARSALRLRVEDFLLKPATAAEVIGALERALSESAAKEGDSPEGAARPEGEAARLDGAVAYMADRIRAALSEGSVDTEGIGRYALVHGAGGELSAVVAARAEAAEGDRFARPSASALSGFAALAERCLSAGGRVALAGAGRAADLGLILCAQAGPAAAPGTAAPEAWLRPALELLAEAARSELGLHAVLGAAVAAVAASAAAGPGRESSPALGAALAQAASRALAIAGRNRPIVIVPLAPPSEGEGGVRAADLAQGGAAARALELMETRYAEDLSLDSVAAELGVSPSHLSRLLGRQTGLGFADCLGRLRVEKAKSFLAAGRISVKEAAAMVGYKDPAYFARVFRRFLGMNPVAFRDAKYRGDDFRPDSPAGAQR
jgi:two-component system, response regulator YesN